MAEAESTELHSATVAKHYNALQEAGLEERTKSRIFYLRNFNNWIKSMAISDVLTRIRRDKGSDHDISVLDLCCGKGGDLLKFKKGRISRLVCADIAATSVEQCEARYKEMVDRNNKERHQQKIFQASQFIAADCTKLRLRDIYRPPVPQFDLTSCQFSFHYSFESYHQAEMMIQNACECLKPGGYFIGTTPNAYELVKRFKNADSNKFGNEVYSVTFDSEDKDNIPLFGAKYDFHLEGVVDCPEFLVYFPLFEKLAAKHDMKLVYRKTFAEFFEEQVQHGDGRGLIGRMQGLEPYPPEQDIDLLAKSEDAYASAKKRVEELKTQQESDNRSRREQKLGTLSQDEWEAATIYLVFAFQKASEAEDTSTDIHEQAEAQSHKRRHQSDVDESEDPQQKLTKTGNE